MERNVKGIIASMVMVGLLMATACSKESVADHSQQELSY